MAQFKEGDEVYSSNGDLAVYVKQFNGRHVVAPVCYNHHGEETYEDVETWSNVYELPPIKRLSEDHTTIRNKIDEAKIELNVVFEEKKAILKEIEERTKLLKSVPDLSLIMDFQAGMITHFVVAKGYNGKLFVIETFDSALESGSSTRGEIKLLTLFGTSKGDYQYKINRYSDGSGGNTDAWPVRSKEEGEELIKTFLIKNLNAIDFNDVKRPFEYMETLAKNLEEYGIHVPCELTNYLKDKHLFLARERLEKSLRGFTDARTHLLELETRYGVNDEN